MPDSDLSERFRSWNQSLWKGIELITSAQWHFDSLVDWKEHTSKANSERQVSETWRTIERLTEIIHGLRNHLDGDKLSQNERAIDVTGVLLKKERFQSQVRDLEHFLVDHQAITKAVTRRLVLQEQATQRNNVGPVGLGLSIE